MSRNAENVALGEMCIQNHLASCDHKFAFDFEKWVRYRRCNRVWRVGPEKPDAIYHEP
jgi:hypothetical protein